jgi:CheY-like chemotaxis protein
MRQALIIEDSSADVYAATGILVRLGVGDVKAITSVAFALEHLQQIADGRHPKPELILLDLNFEKESGFEILRYWKSTPTLKEIRIIVWTLMGDLEKRMADMFGVVQVVDKADGPQELEKVLKSLAPAIGSHDSTVTTS